MNTTAHAQILVRALRRWSWPLRLRLGTLGFAGALLGAAALVLAGWHAARRDALLESADQMQQQARDLMDRHAAAARSAMPVTGPAGSIERLPAQSQHADDLGAVFERARARGLALERGDYQVVKLGADDLIAVSALLPVQGSYGSLKQFAGDVLDRLPHVALQDLRLERSDIGAPELRARVRLNFYYRRHQP